MQLFCEVHKIIKCLYQPRKANIEMCSLSHDIDVQIMSLNAADYLMVLMASSNIAQCQERLLSKFDYIKGQVQG